MIVTLHGMSTMYCNIVTDIRIAGESSFSGIEFTEQKLLRYLDQGNEVESLMPLLERYGVEPRCINALKHIEVQGEKHQQQLAVCERLCAAARTIGCPVIQLVPLESLADLPAKEGFELTARNVKDYARIGDRYGIRFQLEVIAWAPLHSLQQGLDLIDRVGMDNVQMVIDFWHLWAGLKTTPDDVAKLHKRQIYGVHFGDGRAIPKIEPWQEFDLRGYLAGEGDVPVKEWVDAVKSTGFDGTWSSELLSARHWEWDLWEIARETRRRMIEYAV
jgi:sugar phosphate isomerase/epimerase